MPVNISYVKLFEIKLSHQYFSGNTPTFMEILPSRETIDLFTRLGIRFKNNGNVFHAYMNAEKLDSLVDQEFTLYLNNTDPLFSNYTDIPISFNPFSNRSMLHLHNFERPKNLSEGEIISENDISNFYYPRFRIVLDSEEEEIEEGILKLTNSSTEDLIVDIEDVVRNKLIRTDKIKRSGAPNVNDDYQITIDNEVVSSLQMRSGQAQFNLDLINEPESKYRISINGEEKIIFSSLKETQKPPLGVISLYAEDIKKQWDETNKQGFLYEVDFAPRATQWKYYFISDNSDLTIDEVSISQHKRELNGNADEIDDISFIDMGKVEWMGKKAYLIVSDPKTPIPLKLDQDYRFEYQVKATKEQRPGSKSFDLNGSLPSANANQLMVEKEDQVNEQNARLCSEIYIYF